MLCPAPTSEVMEAKRGSPKVSQVKGGLEDGSSENPASRAGSKKNAAPAQRSGDEEQRTLLGASRDREPGTETLVAKQIASAVATSMKEDVAWEPLNKALCALQEKIDEIKSRSSAPSCSPHSSSARRAAPSP